MSVEGARVRLQGSLRDLLLKWAEAEQVWRDATARTFAGRYITPLEDSVRSALPAMEHMAEVLVKVRSDCGDPRG